MRTLSANLIAAKNALGTSSAWLSCMVLTLNDATVERFVLNTEAITYGGNEYTPKDFQCDAVESLGLNVLPELSLRFNNVDRYLEKYMTQGISDVDKFTLGTIQLFPVNSGLLTEDYSSLAVTYSLMQEPARDGNWLVFKLTDGGLGITEFPEGEYDSMVCGKQVTFGDPICQYVGQSITGVTLSGTDPIQITIEDHQWTTGDVIVISKALGITPTINGTYTITVDGLDTFTLDDTNSAMFSGSYSGSGVAGLPTCNKSYEDCKYRGNQTHFGGQLGLDAKGPRIVVR